MNSKLLIACLQGEKTQRTPFWFMRQAGRYLPEYRELRARSKGFLDLCYNPEWAKEVTLQPIRRFGMDAAILFSDILVIPHALGLDLTFQQGEGPVLSPISDRKGIASLKLENVETHLAPVFETVRLVKKELPKETALIGFAGSPWTVACYMIEGGGSKEFGKVRHFAYADPEGFSQLIDVLVEATLRYLCAQVEAGAEVIQLFDSWAGLLPQGPFERWVIEPTRRIVTALKERYPHIPVIGFPRLASVHYPAYAARTGVDAVSIDMTMPLDWLASQTPATALQGNLDPYLLAADKEAALVAARQILSQMHGRRHIFNLGHGMLPHTPLEHVEALCELLRGTKS